MNRPGAVDSPLLIASLIISACFGSIHAYGVLLAPIEVWLGINRAAASLGYSTALLALTAGVFLNGRLPASVSARARIMACGCVAAAGLAIAALMPGLPGLIAGFGLAYGLANGLAYGLSLELAARAMPSREAMAMGIATAAYGLGAVIFAQAFAMLAHSLAINLILLAWAVVLLLACLAGAALTRSPNEPDSSKTASNTQIRLGDVLPLWVTYLLGGFGGLMILAHAPALATAIGGPAANAGFAAGVVSGGSVAGGFLGGHLAERLGKRWSIALPMLSQMAAVLSLLAVDGLPAIIAALGVIGLSYGTLISAIPGVVRGTWGGDGFADAYGKVFTAWGLAGLLGPAVAGILFDMTGGYEAALLAAAALSLGSASLTVRLQE